MGTRKVLGRNNVNSMSKKETPKQPIKAFSLQGFDNKHYQTTEEYVRVVDRLFDMATAEIAQLSALGKYDAKKPFSFADYPRTHVQVQAVVNGLASKMQSVIETASHKQWLYACEKNDAFIQSIFETSKIPKADLVKMQDRNLDALQTFQKRKVDGMDLSKRVWRYVDQYKDQIELGLDVGLGDGRSAQQLSRDLRQNLKEPDRLFRRVRDKRGNLHLSKNAKAFNPGQGVYRSSAKNAERLTRSEINMAYRESDYLRWQQLDFVIGIEIKVSERHIEWLEKVWNKQNPGKVEICDKLCGKYPKWFKFKGWHPQCMCFAIPIIADFFGKDRSNDRVNRLKAALKGEEHKKYVSPETINDVPDGFKEWIADNTEKQSNWKSSPYFVRDNFKDGLMTKGLKYITPTKKPKPIKTEQQKADIQARWNKRKELMVESTSSALDNVIESMKDAKVSYNEVKALSKKLLESDIIERVGGGDLTKGSCSSLAFAYAGNKVGLDVLDFRDGVSRQKFSSSKTIMDIADKVGGVVVKHTSDYTKASELLKSVQVGREYYFSCGKHAAIIRKAKVGFEYLELQSATRNGFKPLTTAVLKNRFGAQRSHTFMRKKYDTSDCIIDIELLKNNNGFKKLLGYINTAESSQIKGVKGTMK